MDIRTARTLIAAGESLTTEFKRGERNKFNDTELVNTVVCLANGSGGTLLIGVEDDGRITGAAHRHGALTNPTLIDALIANRTSPILQTSTTVLEIDGHEVIATEVPDADFVTGTTEGRYLKRAIRVDGTPECVPFPAHEMLAREIDRGAVDFARLPARGATWSDIDAQEVQRFRQLATASNSDPSTASLDDRGICQALQLTIVDLSGEVHPSLGAILLFGTQPAVERFVPNHETAFQILTQDMSITANRFSRSPLFTTAQELLTSFRAWNTEEEVEFGMLRVSLPLVPETAAREAIANALVHRDYTATGAVRVVITEDAFTVSSPGGFPPGVRLDNLLTTSRPRSPVLADAFRRAGLVERSGRGIDKIYSSLLKIGRDAPDYSRSSSFSVEAVIPLGHADLALARFIAEQEARGKSPLRLFDLRVLHELRTESRLSVPELASRLELAEGETRAGIGRMTESGLIEPRGSGRSRTYHLSAMVYRALDNPPAYVRARGTDLIQREQMVKQFVATYGSITRAQAADLCMISVHTASTMLRRMVQQGQLELRGSRRASHYVAPAD
ncbi:RNA-binding domain-containing protein [Rhodococcus sp. NPDC060090]|uniref:RNA-binding domain-containing protein n=1 Tax=Rhodococcus sp. NPDC060090 TaxID=3347056 RepID=UPI00365242A4